VAEIVEIQEKEPAETGVERVVIIVVPAYTSFNTLTLDPTLLYKINNHVFVTIPWTGVACYSASRGVG
jgi:hypothetical protein